jgi:hypothetical protein
VIREQFPSGDYPPHASMEQRIVMMLLEAPGRMGIKGGLEK